MEENKCKFVSACDRSLKTGKQLRYLCEHWRDGIKNHKNKIKGTGCKCAITFNLSGCSFELFICIKKSSCLILCKNLSTTVALSSLIARLRSFHIQLF